MIDRRYPLLALSLGFLLLQPAGTFAAGKGRPSDVNYSRTPAIESHASALSDGWKKVDRAVDRSAIDLDRAVDGYMAQIKKAEDYRDGAQAKLADKQAEIDKYRQDLKTLSSDINKFSESDPSPEVRNRLKEARKSVKDAEGKISSLEKEARQLQSDYSKASAEAEKIRDQVNKTLERDFNIRVDPSLDAGEAMGKLGEEQIKRAKLNHASRITDQFLDDVKGDYLKSGLLVSDLELLKAQRDFTDEQIAQLQAKMNARLDNTMLGKYVHEQIGKAMIAYCRDPKVAAACASGNVSAFDALLRSAGERSPAESNAPADAVKARETETQKDQPASAKVPAGSPAEAKTAK